MPELTRTGRRDGGTRRKFRMRLVGADELDRIRESRGVSKRQLGRLAGFRNHSHMMSLLAGKKPWRPETVIIVGLHLKADISHLFVPTVTTASFQYGRSRTPQPGRAAA